MAWALVTPKLKSKTGSRTSISRPEVVRAEGQPEPGQLHHLRADRRPCRHSIRQNGSGAAHWTGLEAMGSDKTVIRAGYGIFHDSAWNQGGQGLWQNPPYYAEVDPARRLLFGYGSASVRCRRLPACAGTPSSTPVAGGAVFPLPVNPASYTGTIQSMNRNFRQGMVQQFNLNVEHQLPGNVVLTAGYAGSRSTHILVSQVEREFNSPSACPAWHPVRLHRWAAASRLSLCGSVSECRQQQQRRQGSLRLAPDKSGN